jgi:hypothetical protein
MKGTLWFIGSGIAIIFAGLFNVLMVLVPARHTRIMTLLVNAVALGLFILAARVIPEAHVYAGMALFLLAGVLTFLRRV